MELEVKHASQSPRSLIQVFEQRLQKYQDRENRSKLEEFLNKETWRLFCIEFAPLLAPVHRGSSGNLGVVLEPVDTQVRKAKGWYGCLSAGFLFELGQKYQQVFSAVKNLDAQLLDDAPCFIVVGKTSTGKSTLLQRLTRLPFHPSGQQICTRAPVKVELRPGLDEPKATLAVYNFDKGTFAGDAVEISMEVESQDVQKAMDALLQQHGLSRAPAIGASQPSQIITSKELRIRVTSATLPVLDVLDLPGILLDGSPTGRATQQLFKRYTLSSRDRTVFICAVDGSSPQVEWSIAGLLQQDDKDVAQMHLPGKSLGVFTRCDRIYADDDTTILQEYLRHNSVEPRLGQGFFAIGARINETTDKERQAFSDLFGADLQDRTSISAVQGKVKDLYMDQVQDGWIPKTVEKVVKKWARSCTSTLSETMQALCNQVVKELLEQYQDFRGSELVLQNIALSVTAEDRSKLRDAPKGPCKSLIQEWLEAQLGSKLPTPRM
eukprot:Skav213605  [mRNA]  locus=scaffold1971:81072:82762:+ [translate_table: standard]